MIDDNRIQQVANQYVGHGPEIDEDIYVSAKREAFIEGAKWFKSALWHNASEEPTEDENLLIQHQKYLNEVDYEIDAPLSFHDWEAYIKDNNVIKWCYISDLIQKGGDK